MKHSAIRTFAAGAALLLLLSSCGGTAGENSDALSSAAGNTPAAEPAQDQAGTPAADALPDAAAEEAGEETAAPEMTQEEILALATEYIGKPVDDLIAVIGEPEDRDYAPSCMGDGEDGNLYYDGFTVYTYRENGVETIRIVE